MMRRGMRKMKFKQLKAMILSAVIIGTTAVTAMAVTDSFWIGVYYSTEGYQAGSQVTKNSGSNQGKVKITYSNWINLATNFIICQPGSGTQLSTNVVVPHSDQSYKAIPYYSQYVGTRLTTVLRANSAQGQANYTIGGNWSPNP